MTAPRPATNALPPGEYDGAAASGLYAALRARDARFDGRLFVGVRSTGIYCRPVCRVRTPLLRNCRFFGNPASAEGAGFRPCLRCRPELAPGLAFVDSSRTLAHAAARLLARAVQEGRDVALPEVAARLGVTDRHLRRIFAAEHGVAPVDYLTTQRLLQAKQLLTDTGLPVTEVALASEAKRLRDARWRLSGGEGMSDLLDQLAVSGRTYGLVFERLDVEEDVEGPGYRQVPLQMQVSGRYAALRPWLDEWLGQLRLLRVTRLQLEPVTERPGLLQLHVWVQAFHAGEALPMPRHWRL